MTDAEKDRMHLINYNTALIKEYFDEGKKTMHNPVVFAVDLRDAWGEKLMDAMHREPGWSAAEAKKFPSTSTPTAWAVVPFGVAQFILSEMMSPWAMERFRESVYGEGLFYAVAIHANGTAVSLQKQESVYQG